MILILLLLVGAAVLCSNQCIRRFGFEKLEYALRFDEQEAVEGGYVTLIETVCSRKLLPLPWVKAELTTDASLLFATDQSAVSEETRFVSSFFCLMPYRQIERRWKVQCTKRGIFTVSHAVLVLSDLFATLEISRLFPDASAQLTVLPAVRETDLLPDAPQQIIGDLLRARTLIPDRFAVCGIRKYEEGDSLRDLCISATARFDEPMVWQYQETVSPSMTVLLNLETRDTDRDVVSDKAVYENAIRLCAACLGQAAAMRLPVRLCANAAIGQMPADSGLRSGYDALHDLLLMLAALPFQISERFDRLLQRIGTEGSVLVITAQPTPAIIRYAAAHPATTVLSLKPFRQSEMPDRFHYIPI